MGKKCPRCRYPDNENDVNTCVVCAFMFVRKGYDAERLAALNLRVEKQIPVWDLTKKFWQEPGTIGDTKLGRLRCRIPTCTTDKIVEFKEGPTLGMWVTVIDPETGSLINMREQSWLCDEHQGTGPRTAERVRGPCPKCGKETCRLVHDGPCSWIECLCGFKDHDPEVSD